MIHSMTAFAHREERGGFGTLAWDLRSVNHRYLEVVVRLPEEFRAMEPAVRERVAGRVRRGKVECFLRFQPLPGAGAAVTLNYEYARQLAGLCRELADMLDEPARVSPAELLRWPGVVQEEEPDLGPLQAQALELLDAGLDELVETRAREGARLAELIEQRLAAMEVAVAGVRERLPRVLARIRDRLTARLAELAAQPDESRLEQEMVFLAQKMDVAEELDRLESHIGEVRRTLARDEPVGRRLDFLMQELNREANTLGAKSADTETTQASVELKVLIEQMREQVQNIE